MATKRREACPQTVIHLWDAIAYIKQQKQIPNFDRLAAYMKRVYLLNATEVQEQLSHAVGDGLIIVKKSLGCKGSKIGIEQDGYRIPDKIEEKDGHDWYCFECHLGGEVILCTTCHRVYHESCLENKSAKFVCPVCKNHKKFPIELKKTELNKLLGYTCVRLKEKTRELHRIPNPDDEKWRFSFLLYEPIDLVAMEEKMKDQKYTRLGEFLADAQQLVHNASVYYGARNRITVMARQMLRDCEYDLQEIVQCKNCYSMSNSKLNFLWFCLPCNPPHELVYAKVKGFPYWPAKVIRKHDNLYDVRFFGAHHQRALVEKEYVKPISSSLQNINAKKTTAFNRAYKELVKHQELAERALKRLALNKANKLLTGSAIDEEEAFMEFLNEIDMETELANSYSKSKTRTSRKRKRASNSVAKRPNAKKPANVPVKKNKRFYQESPTSSSPKNTPSQDTAVSEDHNDQNLVSSSSQETAVTYVAVGVQTENMVMEPDASPPDKSTEENVDKKDEKTCDCSAKYEILMKELHDRLEQEHKEDKERALQEFAENYRKEMNNEAKKQTSASSESLEEKHQAAMTLLEAQMKAAKEQEMSKIFEQHRIALSEIKKKQWCYNCENEAIYHCCWNTSYCSVECQQVHWHKEHKRTCRRKR
ncbi:zinc finger MYND domain-containing protein 11 [Trichonephila clavata]|uniref:Zinc finger MYND domain-containing protein 11 n=1 Tax=Trichonephila clavata TaxID=2740835 RepID=A0A8X6H0V1_TRICU|nr:zinc finger MYND domain-containing protein 11 [Trichonephila clavata]